MLYSQCLRISAAQGHKAWRNYILSLMIPELITEVSGNDLATFALVQALYKEHESREQR